MVVDPVTWIESALASHAEDADIAQLLDSVNTLIAQVEEKNLQAEAQCDAALAQLDVHTNKLLEAFNNSVHTKLKGCVNSLEGVLDPCRECTRNPNFALLSEADSLSHNIKHASRMLRNVRDWDLRVRESETSLRTFAELIEANKPVSQVLPELSKLTENLYSLKDALSAIKGSFGMSGRRSSIVKLTSTFNQLLLQVLTESLLDQVQDCVNDEPEHLKSWCEFFAHVCDAYVVAFGPSGTVLLVSVITKAIVLTAILPLWRELYGPANTEDTLPLFLTQASLPPKLLSEPRSLVRLSQVLSSPVDPCAEEWTLLQVFLQAVNECMSKIAPVLEAVASEVSKVTARFNLADPRAFAYEITEEQILEFVAKEDDTTTCPINLQMLAGSLSVCLRRRLVSLGCLCVYNSIKCHHIDSYEFKSEQELQEHLGLSLRLHSALTSELEKNMRSICPLPLPTAHASDAGIPHALAEAIACPAVPTEQSLWASVSADAPRLTCPELVTFIIRLSVSLAGLRIFADMAISHDYTTQLLNDRSALNVGANAVLELRKQVQSVCNKLEQNGLALWSPVDVSWGEFLPIISPVILASLVAFNERLVTQITEGFVVPLETHLQEVVSISKQSDDLKPAQAALHLLGVAVVALPSAMENACLSLYGELKKLISGQKMANINLFEDCGLLSTPMSLFLSAVPSRRSRWEQQKLPLKSESLSRFITLLENSSLSSQPPAVLPNDKLLHLRLVARQLVLQIATQPIELQLTQYVQEFLPQFLHPEFDQVFIKILTPEPTGRAASSSLLAERLRLATSTDQRLALLQAQPSPLITAAVSVCMSLLGLLYQVSDFVSENKTAMEQELEQAILPSVLSRVCRLLRTQIDTLLKQSSPPTTCLLWRLFVDIQQIMTTMRLLGGHIRLTLVSESVPQAVDVAGEFLNEAQCLNALRCALLTKAKSLSPFSDYDTKAINLLLSDEVDSQDDPETGQFCRHLASLESYATYLNEWTALLS